MLRLIFLIAVFCGGVIAGVKLQRIVMDDRCLDAGGRVGATGICEGVTADE